MYSAWVIKFILTPSLPGGFALNHAFSRHFATLQLANLLR